MVEEWKPIIIEKNGVIYDYTGLYEISNLGRVKSLNYGKTGEKILKLKPNKKGYILVGLSKNGKRTYFYLHRLVAFTFIPNDDPINKTEVNHKNELKHDCRVENLEWCDREYNVNYGTRTDRAKKPKTSNQNVGEKIICIETGIIYSSTMEAQRQTGVHRVNISKVCHGERKTAGGYKWKFVD